MPVFRAGNRWAVTEFFPDAVTDAVLITPRPAAQLHIDSVGLSTEAASEVSLHLGGQLAYTTNLPTFLAIVNRDTFFATPVTAPGPLTITASAGIRVTVTGREGTPIDVNQVQNPSFEDVTGGWPDNWLNDTAIGSVPGAVHIAPGGPAGTQHLLLGRTAGFPDYTATAAVYQTIGPLHTEQPYRLSAWVAGFNVLGGQGLAGLNAGMRVFASDASGTRGSQLAVARLPATGLNLWQSLQIELDGLPAPYLQVQLFKQGAGFARFDDVRLVATALN